MGIRAISLGSWVGLLACGGPPAAPPPDAGIDAGDPHDFVLGLRDPGSCALQCSTTCAEATTPYVCPALAAWATLPHDPMACGGWDGASTPAVVAGACIATTPTGSALAKAQNTTLPLVLPDGRRIQPAGNELVFETDGGFPASQILIPGTRFLAVNDYGYNTQSVRIVDTALLKTSPATAEVSRIAYPPPNGVNYGLAYLPSKSLLFASADVAQAAILAFDLDTTTGKLTADTAKTISLPAGSLASAIDISPDGSTMLVGQSLDSSILVISLATATYGQQVGTIGAGDQDLYALHFDPFDATGTTAYATLWKTATTSSDSSTMTLLKLDVGARSAAVIPVGKSPEEMVLLNARWALVANALSDSLSILDRMAGSIAGTVPVSTLNGPSPSALAFDPTLSQLYVTLAGDDALAVFAVDLTQTPPTFTQTGAIPTAWWPTAVSVDPTDSTVYALSGRGHGIGADPTEYTIMAADEASRMAGSVAAIPPPTGQALTTYTATVQAENAVQALDGYPTIQCNGAPYDFPVPLKPEDGASTKIKHVFLIVRENKTFDFVMGGQPGVDGAPSLVLAPGNMPLIYPNAFALTTQFAQMDNYYIDSEQSIQGHAWTIFGRTTDYTERRWLNIWGRGQFSVTDQPGVVGETTPLEGNIFDLLAGQHITAQDMGDSVGGFGPVRDYHWTGSTIDGSESDVNGGCYVAGRVRATCDPMQFSYIWLPNDHTAGLAAGKPNPALLVATNDEGTGMVLDGVSHSPFWPDSLVVVIEDDPSEGGDHVDVHRSIAFFASPWIKHGYVSHAHYHLSSVHKLISDIFGVPYRSDTIANAPLPFDMFTSTPDYTPYTYVPRKWTDLSCNPKGPGMDRDFGQPDNQPGLGYEVWQAMHALKAQR